MELPSPETMADDTFSATAMWDWGDLLHFAVDDRLLVSFDSDQPPSAEAAPPPPPPPESESDPNPGSCSVRERNRDPRLTCSNILEGRVPCSCPEIDQRLEESELPTKKRVRGGSGVARCQVSGCEADISELKGYHRRHRVCLGCANASSVVIDGETKRYCQQCGKYVGFCDLRTKSRTETARLKCLTDCLFVCLFVFLDLIRLYVWIQFVNLGIQVK